MNTINVHMSVDAATVGYATFGWETLRTLASRPDNVKLTAHCMCVASVAHMRTVNGCTVRPVGEDKLDPFKRLGGSFGHAACIMDAFKQTNDGDIHVIADTDAVVIAKGWDAYIRSRIADDVGFLGTTYEDVGGFSSGDGTVQTYKKVPNFIWAALGPQHVWSELDITPHKEHRINITDERLSKIYNLPLGFSVFGEAGYQVPEFVDQNNVTYEGWKQLKPTKDATVLVGLTDYSEEYHVDDVPFVVHQRGGRSHAFKQHPVSVNFFNVVEKYLEVEAVRSPRW